MGPIYGWSQVVDYRKKIFLYLPAIQELEPKKTREGHNGELEEKAILKIQVVATMNRRFTHTTGRIDAGLQKSEKTKLFAVRRGPFTHGRRFFRRLLLA